MKRTVYLHGRLGKKFGREHHLDVASPAEAIRALSILHPGFAPYVRERRYAVTAGGASMTDDSLMMQLAESSDIHVTPAGLVSGIETVILGVTLLLSAVSVVSILMMPKVPAPGAREEATKDSSFVFDGPENSTEQGHPVPLVYGQMRVGSVLVSAGINTADINEASVGTNPTNPYGGGSYDGYVGSTPGIRGTPAGEDWHLEKGGKGGGGAARSAQEDPNNLQSRATAKILEVISEGEIVGLVDGLKSVYLDDTPLQNADDTFNFSGLALEQRVGLPDQDFIPGFTQTENTTSVDADVTIQLGPVTRTIMSPDVTVARVTLNVPQLYQQDTTNGDLKWTETQVMISVQADGGGFSDVQLVRFVGKTTSGYQRSIDIRLPNGTQRDIRVTRVTPDSDVASLTNGTEWQLLTEIVEAKLSYPDSALMGLTIDARQFGSSIPNRSYEVKGLIVEVPTNYDPVARTYTGLWDGTFKRAWTDCPPWIVRDMIVNRRYGLGARVPVQFLDKWSLYDIAQYCDEAVPDGFGGMQPRYTLNCVINKQAEAYEVIAAACSAFRSMPYWGSSAIVIVQDKPGDPALNVTPANVVDGRISYARMTSSEKRRSVGLVYWNDPEDGYRLTPEVYEDPDLIRRFGRRGDRGEDAVTRFGCTNRGEAHRAARWLLEDERPASNSLARYEVGDDHSFATPGTIIAITDPKYTADRRGGRLRAVSANEATLDFPVTLQPGRSYTLRVTMPTGPTSVRPVTNEPGETAVLALGGDAYAPLPVVGAVWALESDQVVARQFRLRSIATDEAPYEVEAAAYDPTKHERVEQERDLSSPSFMDLPSGPLLPPTDISATEFVRQLGTASIPSVLVSWTPPQDPRVTYFQAQFRRPGGADWEGLADGIDVSRVIEGSEPGAWVFRVRSVNSLGRKTAWRVAQIELDGQITGIPLITDLTLLSEPGSSQAFLSWDMPLDARPLRAEVLYDEFGIFDDAEVIGETDSSQWPVAKPGRYWVRAKYLDATGDSATVLVVNSDLGLTLADLGFSGDGDATRNVPGQLLQDDLFRSRYWTVPEDAIVVEYGESQSGVIALMPASDAGDNYLTYGGTGDYFSKVEPGRRVYFRATVDPSLGVPVNLLDGSDQLFDGDLLLSDIGEGLATWPLLMGLTFHSATGATLARETALTLPVEGGRRIVTGSAVPPAGAVKARLFWGHASGGGGDGAWAVWTPWKGEYQPSSDNTAEASPDLEVGPAIELRKSFTGSLVTPLPIKFRNRRYKGEVDVTTQTDWAIQPPLGVSATINNTPGDALRGEVAITAFTGDGGQLTIVSNYEGLTRTASVDISVKKDEMPTSSERGGTITLSGNNFNSATFARVGPEVPFTSASGSVTVAMDTSFSLADTQTDGSVAIEAKWQVAPVGTESWTDASEVVTNAYPAVNAYEDSYEVPEPEEYGYARPLRPPPQRYSQAGFVRVQNATSVSPGIAFRARFVVRRTSEASLVITFSGTGSVAA